MTDRLELIRSIGERLRNSSWEGDRIESESVALPAPSEVEGLIDLSAISNTDSDDA